MMESVTVLALINDPDELGRALRVLNMGDHAVVLQFLREIANSPRPVIKLTLEKAVKSRGRAAQPTMRRSPREVLEK